MSDVEFSVKRDSHSSSIDIHLNSFSKLAIVNWDISSLRENGGRVTIGTFARYGTSLRSFSIAPSYSELSFPRKRQYTRSVGCTFPASVESGGWASKSNGYYVGVGVANESNFVSSRTHAASWVDKDNNFWIYGGSSIDSTGTELWKYDGQYWTMVRGNKTQKAGTYELKGVADSAYTPSARYSAVTDTDKDGNLWLVSGFGVTTNKDNSGIF